MTLAQFVSYHGQLSPRTRRSFTSKFVVDIREHKAVKECVRIVATPTVVGGGKVNYAGETTTRTVEVSTVKMHLQSVLSQHQGHNI